MKAIVYKVEIFLSEMHYAHGMATTIKEVAVKLPDNSYVAFNDNGNVFLIKSEESFKTRTDKAVFLYEREIEATLADRAYQYVIKRDEIKSELKAFMKEEI